MEPTRTYLLALNGIPGEHTVSPPVLARAPTSQSQSSSQHPIKERAESADSGDSNAREKRDAALFQSPRSGVRSALSRVARKVCGAGKEECLDSGEKQGDEEVGKRGSEEYVFDTKAVLFSDSNNRF